jgi:hypothetical protein
MLHATIVDAVGPLGRDLIHLVTSRDEIAGERCDVRACARAHG